MRGDDISILEQLVNAATGWRTQAETVGVQINILTTTIRDQPVVLSWDETNSVWNIRTGTQ